MAFAVALEHESTAVHDQDGKGFTVSIGVCKGGLGERFESRAVDTVDGRTLWPLIRRKRKAFWLNRKWRQGFHCEINYVAV